MDLRTLPDGLNAEERCNERRARTEAETGTGLSLLKTDADRIGQADEKNCEQMIGSVPLPVGIAGPLSVTFSSGEKADIVLPLATTEAALVASVNRGCKVLSTIGGVSIQSVYHGISRSIVLKPKNGKTRSYTNLRRRLSAEDPPKADEGGHSHRDLLTTVGKPTSSLKEAIELLKKDWKIIGEATSSHLKILHYDIDEAEGYVFLTIFCDTSEAMGMNMTTIAAQAIGDWLAKEFGVELITIAGNVDSDKKPSKRTHDHGRGFEVTASASVPSSVISEVLKTTPEALLAVADAKLRVGSALAGAIGRNLHAANIVAALYLATGQDAAHVVEGSLADTEVEPLWNSPPPPSPPSAGEEGLSVSLPPPGEGSGMGEKTLQGITIQTRLPALLVGVRGGGTALPAQSQCLNLLLGKNQATSYKLQATSRLAESIGAAVLAGELSLLAAQATQTLASAHRKLARDSKQ
ncbi:MAG: hypothetical protein PHX87_02745 [Candidatus Peribacteraceae bacterium]|nr:hypothetical protein [Candidatus Peribacteraceae bacterium]MDD5742326.1 hypothetical protein [Candidatus Peribacteraceae bacterium]